MALADLTLEQFFGQTASSEPTPGGGAVCATTGAAAASLVAMVCRITLGKKAYEAVQKEIRAALAPVEEARTRLSELAQADVEAYQAYLRAVRLPKSTAAEQFERSLMMRRAARRAAEVPLELAGACLQVLSQASRVAAIGNKNAISDVASAALLAEAALGGAALFVEANLRGVGDPEWVKTTRTELQRLRQRAVELRATVLAEMAARTRA